MGASACNQRRSELPGGLHRTGRRAYLSAFTGQTEGSDQDGREGSGRSKESRREESEVLNRPQAPVDFTRNLRSRELRQQQRDGRSSPHGSKDADPSGRVQLSQAFFAR